MGCVLMEEKKNEIILFENQGVKLEVNVKDETVWLNRQQLAKLFDRDIKTIGKHINNALKEELLEDNSVVAKFATTASDGNKRIAATLFIYFLNFYGILYKDEKQTIDNNTLTALTLLIAEFNPKEKEVIIDLIMNFLNND
jgi:glycogen debranching enzyme